MRDVTTMNMQILWVIFFFIIATVPSTLSGSFQQQSTSNNIQEDSNYSVSNNTGDSIYPAIASSGNNVYVVWQDDYFGQGVSYDKKNYDILFARSTDGGNRFENITNLSNNIVLSGRPIITAFENKVYVVWMEDTPKDKQIWFRKSTNNGSTFDRAISLSSGHDIEDSIIPKAIAAFGNDVYVVWRQLEDDGKTGSILIKASNDSGNSFGEMNKVSSNAVYSSSPKVAAFNKSVYVLWDVIDNQGEMANKSVGIFLAKSSDGGINFENEIKLSGDTEFGEGQVAVYSNQVFVAWTGSVYDTKQSINDVYFRFSDDNGNTFGDTILINKDFMDSENVELAATEGRIDAVWQDKVTGNGEIFYRSINNKQALIGDARNLSNTESLSECPSIATSGNSTYVVWEDSTYGNHEIFFKKLVSI
jgi:hypothetical protein